MRSYQPKHQSEPHPALQKTKHMTQQLIDLPRQLETDSTGVLDGLKLIRIPIGTFGGTMEQIFIVKDGQAHAFDTGDQGGGQS
jgi:hypothetical protein